MAYKHGVYVSQAQTSISTPVEAASGVPFIVGTSPVHTVNGKVNDPVLCYSYADAVLQLGYSDDWEKYTLCEAMYSHFKLYAVAPIIMVNVLDPDVNKSSVAASSLSVADGKIELPYETVKSSVIVKSADLSTTYELDLDYGVFYTGFNCAIELLDGGAIPEDVAALNIKYDVVTLTEIDKDDIIGGFDPNTKKSSGLELVDSVFPKFTIVPDLILAPGYSHDPEVAAVMAAKAESINGRFLAKALIDVDTSVVKHYADVPAWKSAQNITAKEQILFFPRIKLGDRLFHLSVQAAGLMAKVDNINDGCPAESPSNKKLQGNAAVLADGTEVLLDIEQANYLNENGVVTTLNFIGGFKLWGNYTACYPANTDVKDYMIPVTRMFGWVGNSIILSYWSRVDEKLTRRFVASVLDSLNIWLNGLTGEQKILGGRIEFLEDENVVTNLMQGTATFHVFITPPSAAQELSFILEYDVSYLSALFG
jgi:phage tail sheath protein FI